MRDGEAVVEVENDGIVYPLSPRLDWVNHSPTGFAWGYLGSGPAQLAVAILGEILGELSREWVLAGGRYHRFKEQVVARLDSPWEITEADVEPFVAEERLLGGSVEAGA